MFGAIFRGMNDSFFKGLALLALLGSDISDGDVVVGLALLLVLLLSALVCAVAAFRWRRLLLGLVLEVALCLLEPLRLLGWAKDSPT